MTCTAYIPCIAGYIIPTICCGQISNIPRAPPTWGDFELKVLQIRQTIVYIFISVLCYYLKKGSFLSRQGWRMGQKKKYLFLESNFRFFTHWTSLAMVISKRAQYIFWKIIFLKLAECKCPTVCFIRKAFNSKYPKVEGAL